MKELALQRAVESAAQQEARLAAAQAASAELEAQVGDLRLFVDVLLATAPDSRPAAELQAANARLTRDLEACLRMVHAARPRVEDHRPWQLVPGLHWLASVRRAGRWNSTSLLMQSRVTDVMLHYC